MRVFLMIALLVAGAAQAQYPSKPVRVFVGYAAGSSTDIVGRVMADRLRAHWKENGYVETRRPGGRLSAPLGEDGPAPRRGGPPDPAVSRRGRPGAAGAGRLHAAHPHRRA